MIYSSSLAQKTQVDWDYPVKPGSDHWKNLRSHQEMVSVCQIPADILQEIKTKDLVEICLNYPLFFVITAFNNMQEGFDQASIEFNGFRELFNRKDAGVELIRLYSRYDASDFKQDWTLLETGKYMERLFFIEILLSQYSIINQLNNNDVQSLLSECLLKIDQKKSRSYSSFSFMTTPLVMGRVLKATNHPDFMIKVSSDARCNSFVNTIFPASNETYNDIKLITESLLK